MTSTADPRADAAARLSLSDIVATIAEIDSLQAQLENVTDHLDAALHRLLVLWQESGSRVPCGVERTGWTFGGTSRAGIYLTHNCQDHGYDLYDIETVLLPWEFVRTHSLTS